jgi:cell division protein FtsL
MKKEKAAGKINEINEIESDISVAKFSISDLQEKVEELEKIKRG